MDKARVASGRLTADYLNAQYYAPTYLQNEDLLSECGIDRMPIGEISSKCNCGATPKNVQYDGQGQGLIRTSDVRPNLFNGEGVLRTKTLSVGRDASTAALAGDLLYTMSGTIGYAAVIPDEVDEVFSFSNTIARARLSPRSQCDSRFIAAFFNSRFGYLQSLRLVSGGIQGHVMPNPFKKLLVPTPVNDAQRYIGDKLRQAERLRGSAEGLSSYVSRLIATYLVGYNRATELEALVDTPVGYHKLPDIHLVSHEKHEKANTLNRVACSPKWLPSSLLTLRLDCNYYSDEVIESDQRLSQYSLAPLNELVDPSRIITNGVRGPDLQDSPYRLVRLQDCRGWSIDFSNCLTISEAQFHENRRCVLRENDVIVAIGGYIGNAAIARRVERAVIGQHSAVLPMGDRSRVDSGYLAAFLRSHDGASQLQRQVSGSVQTGVNLEDLRGVCIPVPSEPFQLHVGNTVRRSDDWSFLASVLCRTATFLVESLILGKVTEAELAEAQRQLEKGEIAADRSLLARLFEGGIDAGDTKPLFPDLDAYYKTLRQLDEAEPVEEGL
jgi:type I restriction enzyme S subunit